MVNICSNHFGQQQRELPRDPEKVTLKAQMKLATMTGNPSSICVVIFSQQF